MVEEVLEKARKSLDSAEIFYIESDSTEVSYESGILKSADRKTLTGVALRAIHNGCIGFSSTTDSSRIDDMIDRARATTKFGKKAGFQFPTSTVSYPVETFDPAVESYGVESMVQEGGRAVSMLRDSCPKGLTNVTMETSISTIRIANTSGLDVSYRRTGFSHGIVLNVIDGDSILWIEDSGEFDSLIVKTDDYIGSIADLYRKSEKKAPKVSGSMPVLFTSRQLPNIMKAIELGVNGLSLVKGESPLAGREGERVLGTSTLFDDPTLGYAIGSRPFDDEGVKSRRTPLFEEGVFKQFLFTIDTASAAGRETTGSAVRHGLAMPDVGISNLVMSPGAASYDDMLREPDECIVVNGVIGGGQSNLMAGDFSVNIMLGFLVRKGESVGRLSDTMVSGNVYEAFGDIAAAGAEIKRTGSIFAPDILFGKLSVSGS